MAAPNAARAHIGDLATRDLLPRGAHARLAAEAGVVAG
jgi:hypothetical protein